MPAYRLIVIVLILARYVVDATADWMNLRSAPADVPAELQGWVDAEQHATAQRYLREWTKLRFLDDTAGVAILLAMMLAGGFHLIDRLARGAGMGPVGTGLAFWGMVVLGMTVLQAPFSAYRTFVVEARYGFNRTTPLTFWLDILKGLGLTFVLGGILLALVLWLFGKTGRWAWVIAWGAVTVFQVFLVYIAPRVIMPMFNRFTPMEDGELKCSVENLARAEDFAVQGVYRMDASKRSAKTNAFFTGFGKSRRVVLFDTLIEKHPVPEVAAILAHEIGHWKMRHILQGMLRSVVVMGVMLFLFSRFVGDARLFEAFRIDAASIYAGILCFGVLFSPIGSIVSVAENAISRRQEYEADRFAVRATGDREAMISALKRLNVDNLSNPTPHRMKVVLDYSHPALLDRLKAIRDAWPAGKIAPGRTIE